ncbi:hypothetical protein EDB85DRAFT_1901804 [Lactarius pseudohatsudake]|nr:hypothetical protein EDB85DRAFT_1901804 [Lactarius pseudohatsudake]
MPRSVYGGPQISRLEALGVLLRAFPSAVAAALPLSLSNLRPTAVYGGAVSMSRVGKLGVGLRRRCWANGVVTLYFAHSRAFPRLMSFATPRPRRLSPYLRCLGRNAYRPYSVSSHQQESASLASIQVEICVCGHPSLQNHPSPPHRQLDRKLLESCSGPPLRRCYGRDPTFRPPRPAAVAEVLWWRALRGPLGGVSPAARRSGAGREWSTPPLPPLSCGYSTLPFKLTPIPSLYMYK